MRRGHEGVVELIRSSEEIVLSVVVIGELIFGFRSGNRFAQNARDLEDFLGSPYVTSIGVSQTTADRYGSIASKLRSKGTPIPTNDLWIAAHALETGANLATFDEHFDRVEGLFVVRPDTGRGSESE